MEKSEQNLETLSKAFLKLITAIGEKENREGLKNTPLRAAKAWQFLTQGYKNNLKEIVRGALFNSDNNEMVLLQNIALFSFCEHHLLPIIGRCHVAYIPHGKIIGLSKIPRIVDMYSRRLQVQENLTLQIAEAILEVTNAAGVGVIIEAEHLCMMARGVEKKDIIVKTSSMLGTFKTEMTLRKEFLSLLSK
jgi:GTP cyclohydrolase IA